MCSRTLFRYAAVVAVAAVVWTTGGMAAVAAERGDDASALPETPVEYERYALKHEASLQVLYEDWKAALSEADAAGSRWPQPRLGYQAFIDGFWLEQNAVTHMGTISQTFPWPGVLDDASDPAAKRAESIQHRFEARVLKVVYEVRVHLIEIARIERVKEILDEQVTIYGDVRSLVERSMESDEADYGDLLRVSTAREKIVDRIDVLESRRESQIAELRELLAVDPETDLTFDFEGEHALLDVDESLPNRTKLARAAARHNPALAAERSMAEAKLERAEYARARRLPWPTVSLGVRSMPDYMGISGYDRRTALIVGVSLPLPIYGGQYENEYRQFDRERSAALARRTETKSELVAKVDASVTRIAEKRRRLERYRRELLPLASDATEQMLQQIETGERRLTDYLLSIEQELDLETNVVDFKAAIAEERSRLEWLTGGEFQAFPNRASPDIDIEDTRDDPRQAETDDE